MISSDDPCYVKLALEDKYLSLVDCNFVLSDKENAIGFDTWEEAEALVLMSELFLVVVWHDSILPPEFREDKKYEHRRNSVNSAS